MTTHKEALNLPPMPECNAYCGDCNQGEAMWTEKQVREYAQAAVKEALAQPEQEPSEYMMEVTCTKCGATESGILKYTTQPQPKEPDVGGVLFAVEEAIKNGCCPWQIESAFDEYEAERKAAHGIKE